MESYNKKHSELLDGEIFLTNTQPEDYCWIGYKTKRQGNIAYSTTGYIINDLFPVFVQKKEYDDHMNLMRYMKLKRSIITFDPILGA